MPIYKVHFTWKEKEVALKARQLDMTHPYFVSIKDLVFPKETKLIIDPTEDEVRNRFGASEHIMLPFQSVILIEEFKDEESMNKVRPFSVVDSSGRNEKSGPG